MAPVITPVTGPSRGPDTSTQVDQQKVDMALRTIRADLPMNQSQLANALRNPNLNPAERNQIVSTLANEEGSEILFYGNDAARTAHNDGGTALSEDQKVIADALQQACDDGAITPEDLLRIADANEAGNGAQRLMAILRQGDSTTGPDGVAEQLADALWNRAHDPDSDRTAAQRASDNATASIFYTSDPAMMSRNLNTPGRHAEAFAALVDFNANDPYKTIPGGFQRTAWQNAALTAEGRLFTAYGQELTDHFTQLQKTGDHDTGSEVLAKFMSQTLFNPDAQGLVLDRTRDLIPAISSTLQQVSENYMQQAQDAPTNAPGGNDKDDFMERFGTLSAAISGGALLAMDKYEDQIMASEASRDQFAGTLSTVVGMTPAGKVPGSGEVTSDLAGMLYDAITESPKHPDQKLASVLYDTYAKQVSDIENKTGDDLTTPFKAARADEMNRLAMNLDVKFGDYPS